MTDLASRPGVRSSEFWLTALGIGGVILLLALGRIEVSEVADLWPVFAGVGAYAVGRSAVKAR